jgi:hypothetical protein
MSRSRERAREISFTLVVWRHPNGLCSMATLDPELQEDLESKATCTFSSMLTHFLRKCIVGDPPDDPLQKCLEVVLPLCNDKEIRKCLIN